MKNSPNSNSNIEEVKKLIEKLKAIDLKPATVEQLQPYISNIMDGYSVRVFKFPPEFLLYRGIKYHNKPDYYEDIIYPPKDKAKLNRASYEGEQMFYASSSKRPVFYELNANPGDKLVISTWRTNNDILFNSVGYTKSNFAALASSRLPPEVLEPKDDATDIYIADFLAKTFCQAILEGDKYLYNETIAIAKIHLEKANDNKFSGLFYPTVQLNAEEENFAITKEAIDHNLLNFIRIEFVEVMERMENKTKYRIIDVAESMVGGVIIWENLTRYWTVFDYSEDLNFVKEDGQLVAYDNEANVIEPDSASDRDGVHSI